VGVAQLRLPLSLALLTVLLFGGPLSAEIDEPEVRMTVVPSAASVAPGGTVALAVHFVIEPGWHVYWSNPGASGLATEVSVVSPEGWTVGPTQYPVPQSFGDIETRTYGWEGSIALVVDAVASEAGGAFEVSASWLACRDTCIPGKASRTVQVGVGEPSQEVAGTSERFAAWRAALPRSGVPASAVVCEAGEVLLYRVVSDVEPLHIPSVLFDELRGSAIVGAERVTSDSRTRGSSEGGVPGVWNVGLRFPAESAPKAAGHSLGLLQAGGAWYDISPECP
jgi:hypothetical protein